MQYVKNDMDELFKRAAENYPLNTNSADWSKVAAGLHKHTSEQKSGGLNYIYRSFFILLFIALPFICNHFIKLNFDAVGKNVVLTSNNNPTDNKITKEEGSNTTDSYTNTLLTEEKIARININDLNKKKESKINLAVRDKVIENKNLENSVDIITNKNFSEHNIKEQKINNEIKDVIKEEQVNINDQPLKENVIDEQDSASKNEKPLTETVTKAKKQKNKKLYAGFIAGTDITTIKFQKTSSLGKDFGVVIGYDINKKLSIEAGILSTKKYYYTDGKYYNAYKMNLPSNTKIIEVDGNCQMIEIPISIKYDFSTSDKKTWFATAGLCSFVMKKENYDYTYLYLNSGSQSTHFKSYKNSTKNIMSVLQITGGYQINVKNIADVRLEPYVQVPINGLGKGDLPMTSLGLRLGITKKIY